jgi:hypothetical protein
MLAVQAKQGSRDSARSLLLLPTSAHVPCPDGSPRSFGELLGDEFARRGLEVRAEAATPDVGREHLIFCDGLLCGSGEVPGLLVAGTPPVVRAERLDAGPNRSPESLPGIAYVVAPSARARSAPDRGGCAVVPGRDVPAQLRPPGLRAIRAS